MVCNYISMKKLRTPEGWVHSQTEAFFTSIQVRKCMRVWRTHTPIYTLWNYVYLYNYFDITFPYFTSFLSGWGVRKSCLPLRVALRERPQGALLLKYLSQARGWVAEVHSRRPWFGPIFRGSQGSVLNPGSLAHLLASSAEVLSRLAVFLQYKSTWKIRCGWLLGIKEEKYLELREQNTQYIIVP